MVAETVAAGSTPVVIIGGCESNDETYLGYLRENIPDSVVILYQRHWPFDEAAADTWRLIRERGIDGHMILVGHSWGGLIARRIAANHPDMVLVVVTIARPSGGFWGCPKWIFRPGDEDSKTPLFVIAGYKGGSEKWFSRGQTDGVVDVISALDVGRETAGIAVFPGLDHMDLLTSPDVVKQINRWLESLKER